MPRQGTFTLTPESNIQPGDSVEWDLRSTKGGPRNKRGYFKKYLPFDGVVVDSYEGDTRLEVEASGMAGPVPTNTARTFNDNGVNYVRVSVPSSASNAVAAGNVKVILFRNKQRAQAEQASFSLGQVARDIIPGLK